MEQIYTIPVNEAFEECIDVGGCPFCSLSEKLEKDEIDLILGASMMEPDIRKKTNEMGFCGHHFKSLLAGNKKLPLALIMESHLAEVDSLMPKPGIMPAASGAAAAKKLSAISDSCYVCSRVENNFSHMLDTAAYLWETDPDFRRKCKKQAGYCVPHFARFLTSAKSRMRKGTFADFYKAVYEVESTFFADKEEKLSRFVKSFDYRNANVPIDDARDAVERSIDLVSGK